MLEGNAMYNHVTIYKCAPRDSTFAPQHPPRAPHRLTPIHAHSPGEVVLKGYWWTCVAMRAGPKARLVLPAEGYLPECSPWPYGALTLDNSSFCGPDVPSPAGAQRGKEAWQQDMSWFGNVPTKHDFFFSGWRPEKVYPLSYMAWVDEDGYSVLHAHGKADDPGVNNGTKSFVLGFDDPGIFKGDFQSNSDYANPRCLQQPGTYNNYWNPDCSAYEHVGGYTELQTGPAHSQMHTFPLAAGVTQWTEVRKAWQPNATRMHAADYYGAEGPVQEVEAWLASPGGLPFPAFQSADRFLEALALQEPKPEHVLSSGQPWGALHERLSGKRLAAGAPFSQADLASEPRTRAWVELLDVYI